MEIAFRRRYTPSFYIIGVVRLLSAANVEEQFQGGRV